MLDAPLVTHLFYFFEGIIIIGANLMVQSTLIITVGLFLAYALKKKGAVVQSLILRIFLIAVLLCPLVSFLFDAKGINTLRVIIPRPSLNRSKPAGLVPAGDKTALTAKLSSEQKTSEYSNDLALIGNETLQNTSIISNFLIERHKIQGFLPLIYGKRILIYGLSLFWVICSVILLFKLMFYYLRILYVRNTADDAEIETLNESKKVAREMGVAIPLILQSHLVKSPFLTGLLKPAVLLPEEFKSTKEILIHEFAHLIRGDCLWNLLSQIGIALMPLQPLMRVLCNKIEDTSDYVCDDYVVKHSNNSLAYAKQLANLAQSFHPAVSEAVTGVGIVPYKSTLRHRIERLLEESRSIIVSAQKKVVVYVLLLCMIATFLTGFIGFRREKVSAEILIDTVPWTKKDTGNLRLNEISNANVRNIPVTDTKHSTTPQARHYVEAGTTNNSLQRSDTNEINTIPVISGEKNEPAVHKPPHSVSQAALAVKSPYVLSKAEHQQKVVRSDNPESNFHEYAMAITDSNSETNITNSPAMEPDLTSELSDCDACILEGNKLLISGEYAQAEKVFLKALSFKPKDPDIHNYLGKVYFGKREYTMAILFFKKAADIRDNFAEAYYNLGDVFFEKGNLEESMKYYKLAIKINPGFSKRKRPIYLGSTVRRVYN
ncbi:MAG: tetratricopeptide repeat protein [Candidatus Latescibacteria bacterium]|nr:tetratricopeptide repeat protein [Candidatus Latescibacterota bacterium]